MERAEGHVGPKYPRYHERKLNKRINYYIYAVEQVIKVAPLLVLAYQYHS